MELSNLQLSVIKKNAKTIDSLYIKRDKLKEKLNEELKKFDEKIQSKKEEFEEISATIDSFEFPVLEMTGGFTSQQIADDIHLVGGTPAKVKNEEGIWIDNPIEPVDPETTTAELTEDDLENISGLTSHEVEETEELVEVQEELNDFPFGI